MAEWFAYFEDRTEFTRLEKLQLRHVSAVYASPEQIYAIAEYETEGEMKGLWQRAAREVAYKIQSRLYDEHDGLRWEIYLLLFVTGESVNLGVRKVIENDREYFRKMILTKEDTPIEQRLPSRFDMDKQADLTGSLLFEEIHFLDELKGCLSDSTTRKLGERFFIEGINDENELLMRLFPHRIQKGGTANET